MTTTKVQAAPAPEPGTRRIPLTLLVLIGVLAAPLAHALPSVEFLLPLKLVIATYAVLLLPGAVVLRVIGFPRSPAAVLPACLAWSAVVAAPGLMLVFILDRGFWVLVVWMLIVVIAALVAGYRTPNVSMTFTVDRTVLWLCGGVALFTVIIWLASLHNWGDAVEHIARMRKLTELDPPRTLADINLLPPATGMHPGYAFPLWHAVGGAICWIGGLEETFVFRYWSSLLFPITAAAMYGAGRAVFGSRTAGVLVLLAFVGQFGFANNFVGYFDRLAYPGNVCIFILWPLVIERSFAHLREGGREAVLTVAAASLVVSIIHASYVPFMIMLIGGFIGARALLQRDRVELRRGAVLVGALTVPFALFMVWLYPIASHGGASLALETFATIMNVDGSLLSMKTEWVSRGGAAQIAALLLVPLAGAATWTRAGVFIASTTAIVILILIVPWFFTPFSAVMSVSQGRRLLFYLPWAFALAGGAMALARFGYIAVAGSLVAGVVLQILWPGDFAYTLLDPGPQGVAWFAGISAIVVLLVGLRRTLPVRYQERWAVPIVAVLLVPAAVVGLFEMRTVPLSDPIRTEPLDLGLGIGPSLAKAVTRHVGRDDVLLAEPPVAFRLTAVSPVYIVAAQDAHGGDTAQNRHQERRLAVLGFYFRYTNDATRAAVLRDYDVDWVLTRQHRSYPRAFLSQFDVVYETKKFVLYRISDAASEGTPSSQG